jgi:2-isopropylmalate synthase
LSTRWTAPPSSGCSTCGPIAALVEAINRHLGIQIRILDYHEHAMASGADATAYVEADIDNEAVWGVSVHPSIVTASLHAFANAINRRLADHHS